MESDSSARVEIPANFEDAPVEYLVQLIGELSFPLFVISRWFVKYYSRYDRSINVT